MSDSPLGTCLAILFHASPCKHDQGHDLPHETVPQSLPFFQEHLPAAGPGAPQAFRDQVNAFEHRLIEDALVAHNGSVSRAAKALGFGHHQQLISLLNTRHKDLLNLRTAKRRRHKPIVQPYTGRGKGPRDYKRKQMARSSSPTTSGTKLSAKKHPRETGKWEKEAL